MITNNPFNSEKNPFAKKRNDFCKWKTVLLFYIKQIELDKRDNFNGGFFDGYLES